jgi:hypothetical protein
VLTRIREVTHWSCSHAYRIREATSPARTFVAGRIVRTPQVRTTLEIRELAFKYHIYYILLHVKRVCGMCCRKSSRPAGLFENLFSDPFFSETTLGLPRMGELLRTPERMLNWQAMKLDVKENDSEFRITADVPGFTKVRNKQNKKHSKLAS